VVVCVAVAPAAADESAVTPAPRMVVTHDELEATGRVTLGEALALLPIHVTPMRTMARSGSIFTRSVRVARWC